VSPADNLYEVPEGLPAPVDEGACDHLPTFEAEGKTLIGRLTLVVRNGRIEEVFYPVFPPGKNAEEVLEWLSERVVS
jgi:hypothetical protein